MANKSEGSNWIEKSSPTGISGGQSNDDEEADYALGISGESYLLGPLSTQIYDAITSVACKRFPNQQIPDELSDVYKIYAMDLSAKQATELALKQNNLQLASFEEDDEMEEDEQQEREWGLLENIKIEGRGSFTFESLEDAVTKGNWNPGEPFSFIVRNVRARQKELDISELLQAIDPDGSIRDSLDDREDRPEDPRERILSLTDLGNDCEDRCEKAPRETSIKGFAGGNTKGYQVIPIESIQYNDQSSTIQLMDALESHNYIVIDLGEEKGNEMRKMWSSVSNFFNRFSKEEMKEKLPKMTSFPEAGSKKCVVGYASYEEDSMQFMETRITRDVQRNDNDGDGPQSFSGTPLLPAEVTTCVGDDGIQNLLNGFRVVTDLGKKIVTIAIAASTVEATDGKVSSEKALQLAQLTTDELLDDGFAMRDYNMEKNSHMMNVIDTSVCMSPLRLCKYSSVAKVGEPVPTNSAKAEEVFGAHTDTTFVTIVPVAQVSGLEVYDESSSAWVRPELIARMHYENEMFEKNLNYDDESWHSRYVVVMTGELLQIVTRGMIESAVHRVVAATGGDSRLSAPILLRARANVRMDTERYFGFEGEDGQEEDDCCGDLLNDTEGMTMEEVHDALQPSARR
eukprot:CAMPEP_0178973868 /NCGR_PEP_ID=MMETSP0789-20121207/22024_1 /TAXON_ID=3005 /ORGANISM="Rhizosolenia setigera, Strain CCMP 1694" /LENGTH=627 /DNA_ID=CAMNT_0020661907 /DNA_START=217 /DNA_END=2100 /DNA_ORIENTATION=-